MSHRVKENLVGQDFGLLHVEEKVIINHNTYWRCSCKCGKSKIVLHRNLKNGTVKSCGCRGTFQDSILFSHASGSVPSNTLSGRFVRFFFPRKWECSYIKCSPPRQLSEEQKEAARQRFQEMRDKKKVEESENDF